MLRMLGVIVASMFLALNAATAQSEPPPVVKIVVGSAPGGILDPYARIVGEHMSKTLGRTIIIENKPGASGTIATQFVVDQPADGGDHLGRYPSLHRDQSERLSQSALDHRRFHSDREGRRGAAHSRRTSERAGEKSHRTGRLDQGQSRQARLCFVQPRHAVGVSRPSARTSASGSILLISSTGARVRRPTT